ncbi:MAG TPA: hypothetical protein VF462_11360 [Micromonosporaceae bacterium]
MVNPTEGSLAAELRELGRHLDVPEAPDLRPAVLDRLAAPHQTDPAPRRRFAFPRRPRWLVAVASAILVCALVAVSPARAAVADAVDGLLRFAGIEIRPERVNPELPAPSPLPSVRHAGLDEARRLANFPVRVPDQLGEPERVSVADPAPDGSPRVVSLFYRGGAVRLDEFDGALEPAFMKQAQGAEWVALDGYSALWFPAPHPVTYIDRTGAERVETARLAGPTLIWTDGSASYRLEGVATREEAQRIAESLSP